MPNVNYIAIPFKTESGLSQIEGMSKFSPAGIVLECESKLFGIINNGVKENRIALDDILDVKFRKGFLKVGARIEIRLNSLAKLSEMPSKDGKITLKIKRGDHESAQQAVEKINDNLAERQEFLPPAHPPVSRLFDETEDETKKLNNQ